MFPDAKAKIEAEDVRPIKASIRVNVKYGTDEPLDGELITRDHGAGQAQGPSAAYRHSNILEAEGGRAQPMDLEVPYPRAVSTHGVDTGTDDRRSCQGGSLH